MCSSSSYLVQLAIRSALQVYKMAESEQSRQLQPGFNNDGDGHHQSPQRKRSNVEAFDEFGEPLQTSESSKMSSSREELELLEEFADIVQQRLDSCGQIYSSADEVYLLPGFMPQTDSAIKRCQDILQQAKNILHSASHQDNNTHDLGKAINDAMFKEDLPTRRIGFVGDSGAGKSIAGLEATYLRICRKVFTHQFPS